MKGFFEMQPPEIFKIDYQKGAKYVVADKLHGGMGTVYKLFPVAIGASVVAMKTIRGDSSVKAFDIECEAWFSVAQHPHIARPLAFGTWESLPSILIEWYPQSLNSLDLAKWDGADIQRIIAETVSALHFANEEKGLIHQDIKPANILIDTLGKVRLSDFGLARCLVPNEKVRISMGVGGVPKSTSKELSGTPYFMAPELWAGATPSIRTDIFSLGVTFYHCLTGEHPFVEDDSGLGVSDDVRLKKLNRALELKGSRGAQIIELLKDCLAFDPKQRCQSYDAMLADHPWLKLPSLDFEWSIKRSEIIASGAQFFRVKGDPPKARALLEGVLSKRPRDVILIEELAKFYVATGQLGEAELHLGIAYNNLRATNGIYEGKFKVGPAFSWVRSRINAGRFEEAASIVEEILTWERKCPSDSQSIPLIGSGQFSELGWYFLYRGEYSKAIHELLMYVSRYALDKLESIWAIEAAWLSGSIKLEADELAVKLLEIQMDVLPNLGEKEFVFARTLLREYANPLLNGELWKTSPSYLIKEIRALEIEEGLPPGSMLIPPPSLDKQKPLVLVMDNYSTGGINNGYIRSLSKI